MPEPRVTAYWYAATRGLPCDLEYLTEFGLQAARRARWLGLEPLYVAEGPFWVHTWPERTWDEVLRSAWVEDQVMAIYRALP